MNFPFYIARRYLFSKKSTHVINLISGISAVGVAVATMALVVTLSVFNGFHDLVASFLTAFDPQIEVVPARGKTAPADDPVLAKLRALPEVDVVTESVEDQALAVYGDNQAMVVVKGVDDNFSELTHIGDILYGEGDFSLHAANLEYGTVGIRLADQLGMSADWPGSLYIYAPKREGQLDMMNPTEGFVVDSLISPGVVFSVRNGRYDREYILTSIGFARRLFGQQGMLSQLEFRLKPGSDLDAVKAEMREIAGDKYHVLDRLEHQADTFKIMKIEKFIAYIFLRRGVLQHHWLALDAHHRQEGRRGDAAQHGRDGQADNAHLPVRGAHDFGHRCRGGHLARPVAVLAATAVRPCGPRREQRFVRS